ncbi:MAG: hypothetical protein PVJ73_13430 [Acidobacteriota bacterium]|jgi:hypothetical protein
MVISLGMDPGRPRGTGRDLRRIIGSVRRRWRLKVALRGAAITLGFGLVAFAVSAYGMDHFRYTPMAIAAFRVFAWTALAGLVLRFLVLPLFVRLPDERVALYIEEHDPSLQAALLSAVELSPERVERDRPDFSSDLSRRLVEQAVQRCEEIDYRRLVERRSLQRVSGLFSAVATAGMMAALLSPAFIRQAVPFLLVPWDSDEAESPYSIEIEPGHATLARGADQTIVARLQGFDSDEVELALQRGDGADWERWPMTVEPGLSGHRFMVLDVGARTDYFVEASGVRSDLFRLDVVDVPYVERIDLEYHFPEYTGLTPELVEDGGDVAALRGTEVRLRVATTVPVPGGQLVVEGEEPRPLELAPDGALNGSFEVAREAFYRIDLPSPDGRLQAGSPDYAIDVLSDQPPLIRMLKPGRDAQVTAIEEVFTEVEAEDDFGLTHLELVYSVSGAPEKTVRLDGGRPLKQLSAGHTFFLEEHELEPGDFISYFARATDNRGAPGRQESSTDIYFMQIRPFGRAYRQAAEGGAAAAGGGAGGTLSRQQRQIVAATFKLRRDRGGMEPRQLKQDVATLALLQGRLRDQVENLNRRMLNRGVLGGDSEFGDTAGSLQQAAVEMGAAVKELEAEDLDDALAPEQRALQHLQRAEAAFRDVQVAFGRGGGGGGASGMSAEDLSDLFELELDKLENQYEAVQRGQRQQLDEAVDEAMQRLRELARRQEQEVERQRLRASRSPGQGGGGAGQQRRLAQEAEELSRRLERLAREHSTPGLQETARRLKQAADAMRRAGATGESGALSQGLSALDRLRDARQLLENSRETRVARDIERAVDLAEGIARDQDRIADEVRRLGDGQGEDAPERLRRLDERKDELAGQVQALEEQLDRMARETRRNATEASRALREAAGGIRDNKLKEKIRYSKGVVRGRPGETAQQFEAEIAGDIDELSRQVADAARALSEAGEDPRTAALERTRDLVRRVESIRERVQQGPPSPDEPGEGSRGVAEGGREAGGPGGPAGTSSGGSPGPGGVASWDEGRARQLRREFRQRAEDARGIGTQLSEGGGTPADLREIERKLRQLERAETWGDPRGVEALVAETLEDLKMFEYALRRELEGTDPEKLRLSGSDEVPEGWRPLVEEYYRSLSTEGR